MERRQAIQSMMLVTAGALIFPSCDFETFKSYDNLPLVKDQFKTIRLLQDLILPKKELVIEMIDTPLDFSMTMLNDCYAPEDREQYLDGLAAFEEAMLSRFEKPFLKLEPEKQVSLVEELFEEEENKDIAFFLETNKRLKLDHFIKSEYYQTEQMEFEFVPARYAACVNI